MGFVLKIIGLGLLLGGLYGLFISVPKVLLNLTLDEINPLVIVGLIEGGTQASVLDVILSLFLVGIGIIFIKKPDRPNKFCPPLCQSG